MSNESDFIEPEYESPGDGPQAASLLGRFGRIVFYGGSAAVLGLAAMVYASPSFASQVGGAVPESLASLAGLEPASADYGGCCSSQMSTMTAASQSECGSCPSTAAAMASAGSCCSSEAATQMASTSACGGCPSQAASMLAATEAGESECCSSLSRAAMFASAEGESGCGSCPSAAGCSESGECPSSGCGGSCDVEEPLLTEGEDAAETPDMAAAELSIPDATEVFAGGL